MPTDSRGFTLVEMTIAIALAAMVFVGIYSAYQAQVRLYVAQERVVDMMQNARTAMYYMQRSIRMSGFDPRHVDTIGFVANFATPYDALGATTDENRIAFTVDDNEDGVIDSNNAEMFAYRLGTDSRLQRLMIDPVTLNADWETVAEGIDALDFVYLDGADPPNVLAPPLSAADLAAIRSVQVTLVARAGDSPTPLVKTRADTNVYRNQQGSVIFNPGGGDNFLRNALSVHIFCPNLGL